MYKEIVQENQVQQSCDNYNANYDWFSESYRALEWLLSRSCENVGENSVIISDADDTKVIYTYKQDSIGKCLPIWIVFSCESNQVCIYDIKVE